MIHFSELGVRITRKIRRIEKPSRKKRGQSLAEFALVLPILLLIMFGIIDFGWMLFNYVALNNGLREGLRYASVGGYGTTPQYFQCDAIRNEIITRAGSSGIQPGNITIQYDMGDPNNMLTNNLGSCPSNTVVTLNNGYRVVIDVNVTVHFLTPLVSAFAPGGMVIHLNGARSVYPQGF